MLQDIPELTLSRQIGAQDVPWFTDKAEVWKFVKGLQFEACTSVELAFYFRDFMEQATVTKTEAGQYSMTFPVLAASDNLTAMNPEDAGFPISAILAAPQKYNQKRIAFGSASTQPLSAYVDAIAKKAGVKIALDTLKYDAVAEEGPLKKQFADMLTYFRTFGFYASEDDTIDIQDVVDRPLTTYAEWLDKTGTPAQFSEA
ncbi:hypothetical protein MMC29_003640 [Sticta canariensis]|nr:hypothetical protein [Sticta canariensis]